MNDKEKLDELEGLIALLPLGEFRLVDMPGCRPDLREVQVCSIGVDGRYCPEVKQVGDYYEGDEEGKARVQGTAKIIALFFTHARSLIAGVRRLMEENAALREERDDLLRGACHSALMTRITSYDSAYAAAVGMYGAGEADRLFPEKKGGAP